MGLLLICIISQTSELSAPHRPAVLLSWFTLPGVTHLARASASGKRSRRGACKPRHPWVTPGWHRGLPSPAAFHTMNGACRGSAGLVAPFLGICPAPALVWIAAGTAGVFVCVQHRRSVRKPGESDQRHRNNISCVQASGCSCRDF